MVVAMASAPVLNLDTMNTALAVIEEEGPIWERLPREPEKAYVAYSIYRDLEGARSLRRVREVLGKPPNYHRQIERWSSDWKWPERVRAFDNHKSRMELERMSDRKADMKLQNERILNKLAEMVESRVAGGEYELADGSKVKVEALDPNRLDPYRLMTIYSEVFKDQMLLHGEATDIVKGVFMLSTSDVARIVETIVGHAYDFWGSDPRWAMFIEKVQSIPNR